MTAGHNTVASEQTYTQILKSTLVVGGSSVVNLVFALVRNKALAVMVGPEGVGLMGLYSSVLEFTQTLAALGLPSSGVRQIAEADGKGDSGTVAQTAGVLSKLSALLAMIGAMALAALAAPISILTFDDHQYTFGVALLSLAVLFRVIAGGQLALIQGMRGIADIAIINVISGFASVALTVPIIYIYGLDGIVPSLIGTAATVLLSSWWFCKKRRPPRVAVAADAFRREAAHLLRLGFVFMVSGLLTIGAVYAIRLIIMRSDGIAGAGLYQAAWALGGLFTGIVLQAMGTDFYPRLTAIAKDDVSCNRLVNEQTQVSILLAGPGVLATLVFAPVILQVFYSPEFYSAGEMLRWICVGMILRMISWPLGFIIIAKGRNTIFFWTEVSATVAHILFAWLLVQQFGAVGAGAAFACLYAWHSVIVYLIAARLSGFRWSSINLRIGSLFLILSGSAFGSTVLLPAWQAMGAGTILTFLAGIYSLKMLAKLVEPASLPAPIRTWVARFA
jgi:antigen flippase